MALTIFDTKSNNRKELQPIMPGHVRLYVCGITAYDYCHIGHARSVLVFDMIVKYLRYREYQVTYIRNFTDIDDKIINRAREQNTTVDELANRFIQAFNEDMSRLKVDTPTLEPKATDHILEIIDMIQTLQAKDLAYQVDGDVFFRVERFNNYGQLSRRNLDELLAGARVSVNERKENPMDFALWKSSKPGEPTWESPWGPGRPGWHIECSAMSRKYLGVTFDIHGGGKDLIFPHHENEIAQSEGASGKSFVNLWIHHGFVTIKDEKMSKSLGNFLTIREVLHTYHPEVLRLLVFSTHYRNPLDYSEVAMQDAVTGLDRLYSCLANIEKLPMAGTGSTSIITQAEKEKIDSLSQRFQSAMDNDFNTAQGLGAIYETIKILNGARQKLPKKPTTSDLKVLKNAVDTVKRLANVMGLLGEEPLAFIAARQEKLLAEMEIDRKVVEDLILERTAARARKDWAQADKVRDQLQAMNIEIKDASGETTWEVKI